MVPSRYVLLLVAASVSVTSVAIAQASRVPFGTVSVPGSASTATQLSGGPSAGTNLVLNGDFEDYSGNACDNDLANAEFTALMADATAFGLADEIDVYTGVVCGSHFAMSGTRYIGISRQHDGDSDALSLTLATALIPGASYDVRLLVYPDAAYSQVRVGLSDTSTGFGADIFTELTSAATSWWLIARTFVPPASADFVTITEDWFDAWTLVDAIRVSPSGLGAKYCIANGNTSGGCADLTASGSASASAGDLQLTSASVPNYPGLFFHGPAQAQYPYSCGYVCVAGAVVRGSIVFPTGNVASYHYDNSDAKHSLLGFIGTIRNFQYWYRDSMSGGCLVGLSNALSIPILP